jgi:O-antigen ligase
VISRLAYTAAQYRIKEWIIPIIVGMGLGAAAFLVSIKPSPLVIILIFLALGSMVGVFFAQIQKFLLAAILIELPLQVDIYLNYRSSAADINAIAGLNLSVTTICLVILYVMWLLDLLSKRTEPPKNLLRLSLPSIAYLAVVAFSIVYAQDPQLALFEIFLVTQAFLLYIYLIHALRTQEDVLFAVTALLTGLLLEGIIMMGLFVTGRNINLGPISGRVDSARRVGGTVGSPNSTASYLVMLLAPALSLFLLSLNQRLKWLGGFAFLFGLAGLLLTFSRGGWIGFVVSMIVFFYLSWRRGWFSLKVPIAFMVVAVITVLILQGPIVARISGNERAAYARLPLARLALKMIHDHPVLGVGANNFAVHLPEYVTPEFSEEWISTVHNKYLLVWSETGTIGLIAFLWFLGTAVIRGYRLSQRNHPVLSPLAVGFTASLIGFMVHMNTDLFHGRPQVQVLWLVAGLFAAMTNILQAHESEQKFMEPAGRELSTHPSA